MADAYASADEGSPAILRISVQESPAAVTLLLEGRLTGPWIEEVERAWSALAEESRRRRVVDLSGVTFVAAEAKALLRQIVEQAGELRAADVMTHAIIEEVQGRRPDPG
jgi:hypothetical protein